MIGVSGKSRSFICTSIPRHIPDKRVVELLNISGETLMPLGLLINSLPDAIPPVLHEHLEDYAVIIQSLVASSMLTLPEVADYYFYYAVPSMGYYIFTER